MTFTQYSASRFSPVPRRPGAVQFKTSLWCGPSPHIWRARNRPLSSESPHSVCPSDMRHSQVDLSLSRSHFFTNGSHPSRVIARLHPSILSIISGSLHGADHSCRSSAFPSEMHAVVHACVQDGWLWLVKCEGDQIKGVLN